MSSKAIGILVVIVLVVIVLVQNIQSVPLHLFFWSIELPLVLWLLIVLVIGFILGYFVSQMSGTRR